MVGQEIKHYKVEELLGKGGMGVVYRAQDKKLNRPVALKILKSDLTANPDRVRRFMQEAKAAASITHPAIAQVYDIDEAEGVTFIAMEYVDGQTISKLIDNQELDLLGAVEVALQVADGLHKAHKSSILHRDIKSANIMVTKDGHAKLLDFGLAKLMEPQAQPAGTQTWPDQTKTDTMKQTLAGTVLGTIPYMSPEQARGQDLTYSSDVFSLGIVLYEMVAGELPFKGDSPLDTMHAIAFEEIRPVTVIRKNLPPEVHRIIARCLRKRPEDRYKDAGALHADLKRLKSDLDSGVRRPASPGYRLEVMKDWVKTSLPFGATGIVALVAVIAVAALLIFTNINWGSLLAFLIIGLFVYRYIKNRKSRMLKRLVSRVTKFESVKAIRVHEDVVTVVVDEAQASMYIRINSLVDELNKKLYFGKPIRVAIQDDLSQDQFQSMLRETSVVYVRDDIVLDSPPKK
jgi:predicted Ser/Thr protein kinase